MLQQLELVNIPQKQISLIKITLAGYKAIIQIQGHLTLKIMCRVRQGDPQFYLTWSQKLP